MIDRFARRTASLLAMLLLAFPVSRAQSVATHQLRPVVRTGQAAFVSRMDARQTIELDLVLPLSDPAGLKQFVKDVYDPASPSYRHFITPQEFTARFGPTQDQYDAVLRFARNYGLQVVGGTRDGMDVQVKGSVATIETALHVNMNLYQHPTENRIFYAPDAEPVVDLPFSLWHISGLDNYSIPHPLYVKKSDYAAAHGIEPDAVVQHATSGSGPAASYLGSDMRAAYYGSGSLRGTGQNLGLFEYAGTDLADVTTYYTNAHQTNTVPLSLVSADGTSTACVHASGCDDTEQTLDITQALGMAPGLASLVVYVGSYDTTLLAAMTTHSPLPMTIGCSWGWSPADPSALDPYFEKMAAQGQTFLAASGDSSTWSSSNQAWPADAAYVISVGGTDLVTASAAGAWQSETAWADSGGGISSTHTAIPAWQQLSGVINASNHGSTTYRNGPDVSANANFTFYVCADQTTCTANAYGGTSFAAPMWAGYIALVNQQLAANSQSPVGFFDAAIYAQNITSAYASDFHDITSGASGSYSAVTGYDLVTGWGSPNAGLINALAGAAPTPPGFSLAASAATASVAQSGKSTVAFTTTAVGGFNAAETLTATGAPSGVTLAFSPASLTGSGTSTLTITASATAPIGNYTITVKATSGSTVHSTTVLVSVTVPPSFNLTTSPASLSLAQGTSGSATVTTTAAGGFSSAVALTASGAPSGVTLAFSPSSITGAGTSSLAITVGPSVTVGTYTITVSGSSGGVVHTAKITLAVTIAPGFSITASPASLSLAQGASGRITIGSTVVGGFKSAVAFTASGAPSGVTLSFSPASITGAGSSTLTVAVGSSVALGNYAVTISGTSGSVVHTAKFTLTVTIAPGFSITASPASVSVVQGSSGHIALTSTAVGGFKSAVVFTASGAPSGVTCAFSPASVAGAGSSTLTFTVTTAATPGTYPITVTATSGSLVHTVTINLVITPIPPAFAIKASAASISVERGHSATVTVTSTITGAFTSAIALTASGQGTGNTVSFTPASITGAGSSTMQVNVASTSATGAFSLVVSARSGTTTHTVTIPMTVTK